MKGGQYKPIEAEGFRNKLLSRRDQLNKNKWLDTMNDYSKASLQSDGWVCERSREAWMGMQGPDSSLLLARVPAVSLAENPQSQSVSRAQPPGHPVNNR